MKKRKPGIRSRPAGTSRASPAATKPRSPGAFTLSAECTIAEAAPLQAELSGLLDTDTPVTLDAGEVQRIDTAGMQVIAAFVRERNANGRQVQWRNTPPTLLSAARLLGLGTLLGLPQPTP
jgi:phospholipid transport system transporter-binding protein